MTRHPRVKLGDVCGFQHGGTPKRSVTEFYGGDIPWISAADIVGACVLSARTHITPEAIARTTAVRLVPAGTVLLVTRTSVGRTAIAGVALCFSQDVTALMPDATRLHAPYLMHFLRTQEKYFDAQARGAVIRGITRQVVSSLGVPLPPLERQHYYADLLDRADFVRERRRKVLALSEELNTAVFADCFGDPTRAGRWPLVPLEQIAAPERNAIADGPFGSAVKAEDYVAADTAGAVPMVRIANISREGYFNPRNLLYVRAEMFNGLIRSQVRAGDVLVSRVGTLGNTCIFPDGMGDVLLSTTGVCKITPDPQRMTSLFLHHALRAPAFQKQIERSASKSVQKYFNLSALRRWKIIVPPLEAQKAFEKRVNAIERLKSRHRASLEAFETLIAELQRRAFVGEGG